MTHLFGMFGGKQRQGLYPCNVYSYGFSFPGTWVPPLAAARVYPARIESEPIGSSSRRRSAAKHSKTTAKMHTVDPRGIHNFWLCRPIVSRRDIAACRGPRARLCSFSTERVWRRTRAASRIDSQ